MSDLIFNSDLLAATIRIATPVTLAALGGLMCQRAGVFNIALEGFMLIGSFAGIAFTEAAGGNVLIGLIGAMLATAITSILFGIVVVWFKANHIIAGIGINLLGFGLTSFLVKALFDSAGSFRPSVMHAIPILEIPLLKDIPFIGPAIGIHHPVTYLSIAMVAITSIILFKTPFGLAIMSVGESPDAARTAGIRPERVQLMVIIWAGALCGLAGAHLSTGIVSEYSNNMVQGRGFTAFSAVIFGNANPLLTWLVSLLFGFADALGIRIEIQNTGLPPSLLKMFPYILAIVVLTVSSAIRQKRHKING